MNKKPLFFGAELGAGALSYILNPFLPYFDRPIYICDLYNHFLRISSTFKILLEMLQIL